MAIVFPASPSVNETFTAGSITYKWDGDKWIGLGVTPADRLIEGSNSLEIDANNNLLWSGGNLGVNTPTPARKLSITGTDGNFLELKHSVRTGIHYIEHSGTNSETLAFLQNDGSTTNATARIGRSLTAFYRTYDGGTTDTEVLSINSLGTLELSGTVNTDQAIKIGSRSDGNWHGYVNQSVQGGTIATIIGCAGAWDANGSTYNCVKDYNGTFPAAGLAIQNQVNSNLGTQFTFLSKSQGITTTDGGVTDLAVINSSGLSLSGSIFTNTHYSKATSNSDGESFIDFRPRNAAGGSSVALRIVVSGQFLIGEATGTGVGNYSGGVAIGDVYTGTTYMRIGHDQTGAEFSYVVFGHTAGGNADIGRIHQNSAGTAVTFLGTSDYRAKENVTPLTGAISRLNQLKPINFNWIADPDNAVIDGFLAHEVQEIVPEAVGGKKDEVDDEGNPIYQGIDPGKLVPLLTAALQEALAEIETLKGRLDAAGL